MEPFPKDGESAAAAEPSRGAAPSSGVVVQVREKKGPLRAAIPYMPFPVAVICLFLNTFVPGLVVILVQTLQCNCNEDSEATRIDKKMGNNKYDKCSAVWRPVHLRCSLMPRTEQRAPPAGTCCRWQVREGAGHAL
ncbi:protein stum homolog isoform X3 [Caloenas nicobarica]|uniref:protein stum homolog isoform X3 n=1 Tax=Caloenas nicobarica TaxID=187106 RepID=UPI0032B7CDA4